MNALRDLVDRDDAGDQRREIDASRSAIASSEVANSSGDVSEDELQVQLLADAEHRVDVILLHAGTDDQDATVLRSHPHRLLDHPGNTDRLEHHERLAAVDAPPGARSAVSSFGIDDLVAAEVLGEASPRWREVGADDRADAEHLHRRDAGETDRAESDHDGGIARAMPRLRDGVDADGQRLGHRCHVVGEPGRAP